MTPEELYRTALVNDFWERLLSSGVSESMRIEQCKADISFAVTQTIAIATNAIVDSISQDLTRDSGTATSHGGAEATEQRSGTAGPERDPEAGQRDSGTAGQERFHSTLYGQGYEDGYNGRERASSDPQYLRAYRHGQEDAQDGYPTP